MSSSTNEGQKFQSHSSPTCEQDRLSPEATNSEHLLKRRAFAIEELHRAYKAEFLAVVEDLYSQYQNFTQEFGRSGWKEDVAAQRITKPPLTSGLLDEVRKAAEGQGGGGPPTIRTSPLSQLPSVDESNDGLPRIPELEGRADLDSPIPRFGQLERFILSHEPTMTGPLHESGSHGSSIIRNNLASIARLECLASCATARRLDSSIAVLVGEKGRYLIGRPAVSLGRGGPSSDIDVDLSLEGAGLKVSRHQAHLWVDSDGVFYVKCMGRRSMFVDGRQVTQYSTVELVHLSFLEVGAVRLLFMVNQMAIDRMIEATRNRLNT